MLTERVYRYCTSFELCSSPRRSQDGAVLLYTLNDIILPMNDDDTAV
jgi:hypothetical protein